MRAPGRTPEDVLTRTAYRRAAIAGGTAFLIVTSAAAIPSIPDPPAVAAPAAWTTAAAVPFTAAPPPAFTVGRAEHAASRGVLGRTARMQAPARSAVAVLHKARPQAHRAVQARPVRRAAHHMVRHRPAARAAPAATGRLAAVVAYGRSQLGDPYVFGGAGPGGWDCSGLTSAAYARIGVHLPHKAAGQARRGVVVSRSRARPGDLVVWGSHHVGIYVGGGRVLHAPHSGERVQVARIWGSPTFRRVTDG